MEIKLTQPPKPIEDGKMGAADWQRDTRSIIISLRAIANTLILKVLKNLFLLQGLPFKYDSSRSVISHKKMIII